MKPVQFSIAYLSKTVGASLGSPSRTQIWVSYYVKGES